MSETIPAEQSVIGLLALFPAEAGPACEALRPEMFAAAPLGRCFAAWQALRREGGRVDPVLLAARAGEGYGALVLECCEAAPTLKNLPRYAALVLEGWRERTLRSQLRELLAGGRPAGEMTSALEAIAAAQRELEAAAQRGTVKTCAQSLGELLGQLRGPDRALRTGWRSFDALTGGLMPGAVTVIAARPGKGKTDFALQMATQLATRSPVLYQSLEMPAAQLQQRVLARACKINSARLRSRVLTEAEWARLKQRADQMAGQLRLVIDEAPGADLAAVEANLRAYGPEAVFLDHLGLVRTPPRQKRSEELAALTRGVKELALRLDKPVVELVQAGRAADARRMTMADMFGSATIEQDADLLIALEPEAAPGRPLAGEEGLAVEARVLKNRHGGTGTLHFFWKPQYHTYTEMEMER